MNILLDTHIFFWAVSQTGLLNLTKKEKAIITDIEHSIYVSNISLFEMSIKHTKGKWQQVDKILNNYSNIIEAHQFKETGFTGEMAISAGKYTQQHSDPFDCMIAAQVKHNDFTLITRDKIFSKLNIKCL
ncbi:MAG: type II toxin-antitoxin system VapC family toxin [Methylococcales bacterium]|jgi:PIN domain nuclease of toxin-antitoxin system|nr:type II toxin-antitoxin system VapC family toxin [Methylococcales bacterium]MBT7410358.1 type II toxin-antitoxin system VapC family toxin [Methylococcales bacterium]